MTEEKVISRSSPWAFVALTYGLSWSVWISAWLITGRPEDSNVSGSMVIALFIGSFGPGVAAATLILRAGGFNDLKVWLATFVRLRCGWRAYAAALLPFPFAVLVLTATFGYTPNPNAVPDLSPALFYLTIFPVSIFNGIFTAFAGAGPLGEEGGWRGYLLPALLQTRSEAQSSLIIGVAWTLWHLPVMLFFADWRDGIDFWNFLPVYFFVVVALSFLMTQIWLISRGSLFPVIWLHGLFNALGSIAFHPQLWSSRWPPEFGGMMLGFAAILAITVLYLAGWRQRYAS